MRIRTGAPLALLVVAALCLPATAQTPQASPLYLTNEDGSVDGSLLLSSTQPSGDAVSFAASPAVEGAATYTWSTGTAWTDDLQVTGATTVTLAFAEGIDAGATTTVTLSTVDAGGTATDIGTASKDGVAGGPAHEESFEVDATGAVLPEGSVLLLTVTIEGNAAAVQLQYGGDSGSAIDDLPNEVLDSDGDGVGDSEERRQGSDPDDASSAPGADNGTAGGSTTDDGNTTQGGGDQSGAGPGDDGADGSGAGQTASVDEAPVEALVAAAFLLLCLMAAGFGIIGRNPS